jgi:predicted RNA binding protein YcfA (HicA-like mRNA interferase family)
MKAVSGKDLTRILERHGWSLLRIQGSHHIYGKPSSIVRLSVPVHRNQPLKLGLLRHLLKAAGLLENDLT